jgi:hypothetical protein
MTDKIQCKMCIKMRSPIEINTAGICQRCIREMQAVQRKYHSRIGVTRRYVDHGDGERTYYTTSNMLDQNPEG